MDSSTGLKQSRLQQGLSALISKIAVLWGLCITLPLGMQYLCLFLLLILMLSTGRHRDMLVLMKTEKFWGWSVLAFIGITLLSLALQPLYYKETTSNLWHGLRIVLTLMVGLALMPQEAKMALLSAALSVILMSLLIFFSQMGWLAVLNIDIKRWIPEGNEWISLSLLQVMLTVATLRLLPLAARWRLLLCLLASGAIAMNFLIMNQRISSVALVIGLVCLILARWRTRLRTMALLAAAISIFIVSIIASVDKVSDKFQAGWTEIEQARSGVVNQGSMNIRYHMYTKTTDMVLERPLTGWGIGSWNSEWKKRIDPILHTSNMPHNDFLWMGAQAGLPGAMAWLALMLSLVWMGWKQNNPFGHLAFSVSTIVLINSLINSGTRDANLGLPTLFLAAACLAWACRKNQQSPAD